MIQRLVPSSRVQRTTQETDEWPSFLRMGAQTTALPLTSSGTSLAGLIRRRRWSRRRAMDAAPSSSSAAKEESAIFSCHESLGDLSAWWRRTAATLSTADGSAGLLRRDERGGAAGVRVGGARRGCFGGHGAYHGVMVLIMVLGLNRAGLAGVGKDWMVKVT